MMGMRGGQRRPSYWSSAGENPRPPTKNSKKNLNEVKIIFPGSAPRTPLLTMSPQKLSSGLVPTVRVFETNMTDFESSEFDFLERIFLLSFFI